ncbi:hypothetical protein [Pseudoalteromonas tetraodonis]|uniref:hypothetical protein n=1 Tax=Pseudoalteromonas tetraodonis TaxID=43659 RepID=UPI003D059E05
MRKDTLFSVASQGLSAASNFIFTIYLVSHLPQVELGYYALVVACAFIALACINAIVIVPFSVQSKDKNSQSKIFLLLPCILMSPFLSIVLATISVITSDVSFLLVFVYICIFVLKESMKNIHFSTGSFIAGFIIDAIYVTGLLLGILIISDLEKVSDVLYVLIYSTGASFFVGFFFIDFYNFKLCRLKNYKYIKRVSSFSLAGALAYETQSRGANFILSAFGKHSLLGEITAAKTIFQPLNLFVTGWSRVARPRIANIVAIGDLSCLWKEYTKNVTLITLCTVTLSLSLYILWDMLEFYIFKGRFDNIIVTSIFIGTWAYLNVVKTVTGVYVLGFNKFKELAKVSLFAASFTVVTLIFVSPFGLLAILIAIAISELVSSIWVLNIFKNSVHRS